MQTQNWSVRTMLEEDADHPHARAVLTSRDVVRLHAEGDGDRRPGAAAIPEIGEEFAAARAL